MRPKRTIRVSLLVLMTAPAALQAQPDDAASLLRGPEVQSNERPTLVLEGMTGRLRDLSGRPEIVAVTLLGLPNDTVARVESLETERIEDLALALIDELDLVREITDHITAGDEAQTRRLQSQLRDRVEPGRPRSPLLEPVLAVIGQEHETELVRLIDEYWDARIDQRLEGRDAADPAARERAEQELTREMFLQDLRQAYDISLGHSKRAMDAVVEAIDPTPEQRERIRTIVIDHLKETRLEATPAQRRDAMRRIYDMLDEDRRALLFDYTMRVILPGS